MDLFCAALTTVCELVLPLILRYITNIGMNDLASLTVRTIITIGVVYFVLRIIDGMASFTWLIRAMLWGRLSKRICGRMPLRICRSCLITILTTQRSDR